MSASDIRTAPLLAEAWHRARRGQIVGPRHARPQAGAVRGSGPAASGEFDHACARCRRNARSGRRNRCFDRTKEHGSASIRACRGGRSLDTVTCPIGGETENASHTEILTLPKGPLLYPPRPPEPSPHPSRSTIRRTGQPLTASNAGDQLRLPCQPARSRRAIKTPAPRRCQSPARAAPRNAIAGVAYRPDRVAQSEHEACAFGGPSSSSVPASPLRALEPCPHRGVRLGDRRPGAGLRRGLVPLSSVLTVNSAGVQCICTVSIRNMHRDD